MKNVIVSLAGECSISRDQLEKYDFIVEKSNFLVQKSEYILVQESNFFSAKI